MLTIYVLLAGVIAIGLVAYLKPLSAERPALAPVVRALLYAGGFCLSMTILAILTNHKTPADMRFSASVLVICGFLWALAQNRESLKKDPTVPGRTAIRRVALVIGCLLAVSLTTSTIALFTEVPASSKGPPLKLDRGASPTVFVDPGTGCQYLLFPTGAIPRLNNAGEPACTEPQQSPTKD